MEIIANIGFNWYSSKPKERAEELIESAADHGAHAVVVPYFKADKVYSESEMVNRTKQFEMPPEWFFDLRQLSSDSGLEFIVSPRYPECIAYLEQIGVQRYHVQNGDIRHYPLLEALQETDKPVMLSTGYATFEEVDKAIVALLGEDGIPSESEITLLHSTGGLPTRPKDALLSRILDLGEEFFPMYVGLESFYSETILDIISMTYRPVSIMRRYDLDDGKGIEASYSLKPDEFSNLARIASVMKLVNDPEFYIDAFTEADFEMRVSMMRCEHSDFLLPPDH